MAYPGIEQSQKGQELQEKISQKRSFAKEAAINLFQREVSELTPSQKARLNAYILNQLNTIQCCVMYTRSNRFANFLLSIGISPDKMEKKEIVINQESVVLFSHDYTKISPKLLK